MTTSRFLRYDSYNSDEVMIQADTMELVVVGDQSSGKSSLEGLTGLSFPITSDLCTRFATQIVLHRTRSEDTRAEITIIPGPTAQANDELKAYLLAFQHNLSENEFNTEEFKDIFDKVRGRKMSYLLDLTVVGRTTHERSWTKQHEPGRAG